MRTRNTRRCLAAVLAAVLLLGAAAGAVFWNRHRGAAPAVVETTQENAAEQVVFFRQKDDRWKTDTLGDSVYHMADSGCLTCCVAAALQMQQISVDGLPENANAGEVFLSGNRTRRNCRTANWIRNWQRGGTPLYG